jgi:hypothetical protein
MTENNIYIYIYIYIYSSLFSRSFLIQKPYLISKLSQDTQERNNVYSICLFTSLPIAQSPKYHKIFLQQTQFTLFSISFFHFFSQARFSPSLLSTLTTASVLSVSKKYCHFIWIWTGRGFLECWGRAQFLSRPQIVCG